MKIEATKEEARILMCAIAGMELFAEERKAIRPLYMRLLYEVDPDSLKSEARSLIAREVQVERAQAERGGYLPQNTAHGEVVAGGRIIMCTACNDTHRLRLFSTGDIVMCTQCPIPCQECRAGGNGPYCASTPCTCECHRKIGVAK